MSDNQTAMRDSNGKPVFVRNSGEYAYTFPENNIVDRDTQIPYNYTVYFFVPFGDGYKELSYSTDKKQEALDFATGIYGKEINLTKSVKGEVFEVEVHSN